MGTNLTLTAEDGFKLDAYRAEPAGTPRGGLVIVQEIFGLNSHIRNVCDGYAKDGYLCIAPAIFDRLGKGIEFGYVGEELKKARAARRQLDYDIVLKDVAAAQDAVKDAGKVGIIGYCYGGSVAWLGATRMDFTCSVSYYGGNVAKFSREKPKCPVICHIGSEDDSIDAEQVAIIRKARPEVIVYVYQGAEHGFNNDDRPTWYEEAAVIARNRSLEFFARHIG